MNRLLLVFVFFALLSVGCTHQAAVDTSGMRLLSDESHGTDLTAVRSDSDLNHKTDAATKNQITSELEDNSKDEDFPDEDFESGQNHKADGDARVQMVSADEDEDFLDEDFNDDFDDDAELWDEEAADDMVSVADPLAPFNRLMFHFNDKLYFWVLKPVAKGYKTITPSPVRVGVKNFFDNLTAPIRMVNCMLQGKMHTAEIELARFLINSTVGVLGFGDIAKNDPRFAKPPEEDLGQTLSTYGVGNGFYIVWPILGPSTLRDSVGMIGDRFLNITTWTDLPVEATLGLTGFETVNETSFRIGDYEAIKDAAIEPYEAFRDAYIQYRKNKTKDGKDELTERRYDNLIKEWIK